MPYIKNRAGMNYKTSEYITGILFVVPILLSMGIWFYYPVFRAFLFSLQDINLLQPAKARFVGLNNYIQTLGDPNFVNSLLVSLKVVLTGVPVIILLSLIIAVNLNAISKLKGFFRSLYYIPSITSSIAITIVFMYLMVQNSAFVKFFSKLFGLPNESWYANVKTALPFLCILVIWKSIGFYVIIYLAGLQTIPAELYESGIVDGAGGMQKFFYITLPLLKPTTFLVSVQAFLGLMQIFDEPYAIARSAPLGTPAGTTSTVIVYFYNEAFRFYRAGYGSAAAFIIFAILLAVSILQKTLFEKGKE